MLNDEQCRSGGGEGRGGQGRAGEGRDCFHVLRPYVRDGFACEEAMGRGI